MNKITLTGRFPDTACQICIYYSAPYVIKPEMSFFRVYNSELHKSTEDNCCLKSACVIVLHICFYFPPHVCSLIILATLTSIKNNCITKTDTTAINVP